MLTKRKLTAAIAVALGTGVVGTTVVQADSAGFLQVVGSPSVTTIVSVMNTSDENYEITREVPSLHYRLYYKNPSSDNSIGCYENNYFLPTSKNDIQTIDLFDAYTDVGQQGVLFENDITTNNNPYKLLGSTIDYAIGKGVIDLTPGAEKDMRGYLLVDNADSNSSTTSVTGEAFLFEYATGASWGYQAYTAAGEGVAAGEFDYSAYASASPSTVMMMPFKELSPTGINTTFLVTPLFDNEGESNLSVTSSVPGAYDNEYTAYIELSTDFVDDANVGQFALYNRDEVPYSGTIPQEVVCVGRVNAVDLIDPGVVNPALKDGGWGQLSSWYVSGTGTATSIESPAAAIVKLEYGQNTFNDKPFDGNEGSFNNAFYLHPEVVAAPGDGG